MSDNQPILARLHAIFAALMAYQRVLIYLHNLLAIVPIMVILMLLVPLYTDGLGGNIGMGSGIPLAYLVFNQGMRRIMNHGHSWRGGTGPSVHWWWRGGDMAAVAMENRDYIFLNDDNDPNGRIWDDDNDKDIRNPINQRRRRRKLKRL
jgi:hypothetical protein